jgi:EmrB/QacA subfamily drug resistance transporter
VSEEIQAPSHGGLLHRITHLDQKVVVAAIFVVALFMDIMDATIVNTALPRISTELHTTTSAVVWVVLGYLLSLAVWIPASGWVGDRFGTKRTFLFALFVFTAASALCGSAHSIDQLTLYRFIQGIGGGMLTPVGTAMLFRAYPPSERARASAILIVPTLIAPALGPVLGGYITDGPGWRWIFLINVPIGLAAFIFGVIGLHEVTHEAPGKFDPFGFVLSGVSIGAILYALNQGVSSGWTSTKVLVIGLGGLACFVAMIAIELYVDEPMLALRLFKERLFRTSNVVSVFSNASFFGLILLMPLALQDVRGLSASASGLAVFPQALGVICASQLVRKLYPKIGPRRLLAGGLFCAGLVILTMQWSTVGTNLWWIRLMLFSRGLCMAFVFIPSQAASMAKIPPPDIGRASSFISTNRQVSNSLGIAVLITLLVTQFHEVIPGSSGPTAGKAVHLPHAVLERLYDAFKVPFFWTAMFAFAGAACALFIRDRDAAATMAPRG